MKFTKTNDGRSSWRILLVSGVIAVLALSLLALESEILPVIFFVLFLVVFFGGLLEFFGLKEHGDEWGDWREDPVEPLDQVEKDSDRSPLFSEVADPEKFPRRLPTARKRRIPLKKRNRFFSDRRFPNE